MKIRLLWRIFYRLLFVLVLSALAGIAWLAVTESGARFAMARVVAASDDGLAYSDLSGSLGRGIVLSDVSWRDDSQLIETDELRLQLNLLQLFSGRVMIETLVVSEVRYRAFALTAEDRVPVELEELPELPLAVYVRRIAIAGLSIERDEGNPIEIGQIVLSGAAAGRVARIDRFEFRVRDFFISMVGDVGWENGLAVDGVVSWSGDLGDSPLKGNAQVEGQWPTFRFEQKTIEPIAQTAVGNLSLGAVPSFDVLIEQPEIGGASVDGTFDPATQTWRVSVSSDELAPGAFIPGWPGLLSVDGVIAATAATPWRFEAENLSLAASIDDVLVQAELDGSVRGLESIELEQLDISMGANRVELRGTVDSELDLALIAELDDLASIGQFLNREQFLELLPDLARAEVLRGRASADLAITGERELPLVAGRISAGGLRYADLPLEIDLSFASPASANGSISVEEFSASLGASRLSGSGSIGASILAADAATRSSTSLDLVFELEAGDLAQLSRFPGLDVSTANLAGSGRAGAEVSGTLGQPDLNLDVELTDVRYEDYMVTSASLAGQLGLYAGASTDLRLAAAATDWNLAMEARGELGSDSWGGTVGLLTIDEPWLGTWQLREPVAVQLAQDRIEVDGACLTHADSGICVDWLTSADQDRIRISANEFDLGVLAPLLPPAVVLNGQVSLDAALDSVRGAPSGVLAVIGSGVGVEIAVSETDRVETRLETVAVEAVLDDYALQASAEVLSRQGGEATVLLSSADVRDRDADVSGSIDVFWPDLSSLSILSPDVGEVGGTLDVTVSVAGTVADPLPSGGARIRNGRVAVPEWGILVEQIEAEAFSDAGSTLEYSGTGFVRNSEISLSGTTELDIDAGWPTRLRLTGGYVPIVQRPDATIYASPALDAVIDLPRIEVTGRVLIPEADIAVDDLPVQAVSVSPDSVVHGQQEVEEIRPLDVRADVTVELGELVRYTGASLDAQLRGALRLAYLSGQSPDASGGLTLTGVYNSFGQPLALERGELLFAGSLEDPALDVLAIREIGTTRVGVRLTGTLSAPQTSLYSDPPMSDLNTLSYLQFGRPVTTTDGSETVTLEATALALGLQQALPAVQRVGDALGLDELSIEPTEVDAGSLMAGKYLSPKVYLSYTYGLFNRLGGFLLRYQINDRFSLETRSGNEKSMDFLYSVEKDQD